MCDRHGGRAPQVKRKAAERIAETMADIVDPDRMLRECARIAYFDYRRLFDEDGNILSPKDWPADVASVISSVEVVKRNLIVGDDKLDEIIKPRVWDKVKALEMLFKHKGLLTDKLEVSGGADLLALLHEGRKRAAEKR